MRVIAGEARGRRLEALPGTDVTRPTLSQVKEAMFSIVQFDLPGARVLDLYAGSGQLGIEALSRGAARCVFLDESREAVSIVMRNCKACGLFDRSRVNIGEAARFLSACNGKGSVCAMTAEILKAAGYKTGLFTSPVISAYREQFRINGEMISEEEFVRYAELVRNVCTKMTDVPSEFEKAVALAFL